MSQPIRVSIVTQFKWQLFRALERLSDLRGNRAAGHLDVGQPATPLPSIWIFASTIGELNAIDPLLRELVTRLGQFKLVLITDHPHYRESYLARYPQAEVCVTLGHGDDARALAAAYPPRLLVVAEIPCWPADAPCRFSFAFVLEAKRRGAPACIINGWLYHYAPPCRMDAIERRLFHRDYLQAFDAIGVQTEAVRQHLIAAGANPEHVAVTGNIKFDALPAQDWSPDKARSPIMLGALMGSPRPIIVAGCVTEFADQQMILQAFMDVRRQYPAALLVLAPRHPEFAERMQALRQLLAERQLPTRFRTDITDTPIANDTACLVLDTIGELRDFYAAATVAHVGNDHNVLEPLGFEKPVTIQPGWESTYPSYPVYRMLLDAGCLIECTDAGALVQSWTQLLDDPKKYRNQIALIGNTLALARGAVNRHLDLLAPWIDLQ